MTYRLSLVVLIAASLAFSGCRHAAPQKASSKATCGKLVLGNRCLEQGAAGGHSRWKLWTGVGIEGAALVAAGAGASQLVMRNVRTSQANEATEVGERAFYEDQMERHERMAAWAFGVGAPLAVVGAVFIIADVVEKSRNVEPFAQGGESRINLVPAFSEQGGMGLMFSSSF